jgi:hypothetical protein
MCSFNWIHIHFHMFLFCRTMCKQLLHLKFSVPTIIVMNCGYITVSQNSGKYVFIRVQMDSLASFVLNFAVKKIQVLGHRG